MDYRTYRQRLDQIVAVIRGAVQVAAAVTRGKPRGTARREMAGMLFPIVVEQRRQANVLALEFMRAQRSVQGVVGDQVVVPPRPYSPRMLENALRSGDDDVVSRTVESHVRDSARRTVVDAIDAETSRVFDRRSSVTVIDTGADSGDPLSSRSTVTVIDDSEQPKVTVEAVDERDVDDGPESVERTFANDLEAELAGFDAARFARVLSGTDNCALCIWTASRGPVYSTRYAAGDPEIHQYHPGCDCDVVPVWDFENWEGRKRSQYLYQWASDAEKREIARRKEEGLPMPDKNRGINLVRSQLRHHRPQPPEVGE